MKKLALFLSFLFVISCTKDPIIYTLTTSANPADGGTVSPSTQQYDEGKTATITATSSSEYVFQSWSGATGSTNSTSVVMNSDKSVTANFVKKQYPLTIEIEGEGTVSETVIKQGLATDYNSGTIVELTAEPTGDWEFVEWTGDITSTENPVQITVDEAKTVKAKFMRYFDYKTPSYVWKNNIQPRFNLSDIEKENGLDVESISNTGSAYADFNGDGYFDIMSQGTGPDGTYVGYDFFINNGDDTFDIDNSFFNSDFQSDKARKTIVGDFNGDNKPDVVRISGQHDYLDSPNITLSKSDGSYVIYKIEVVPVTQYHGFASGDIDDDGDLDLFFGSPGNDQGFAINKGDGTFIWKKSTDIILNQADGPKEQVQTVEIFDFNNDNNLDLIIGGAFNIREGQNYLDGPTILWGDGTGFFDFNNKSEVFNFNQIPTTNTGDTCNLDDFVFGDINGDGLNEIILMFYICMDEGWGSLLEIYSPNSNFEFKRVTDTMLPDNIVRGTWLQLRDIDKNNNLDIVETELPSWRYEWNGSKFDKIN